jgi:hypothetical protein
MQYLQIVVLSKKIKQSEFILLKYSPRMLYEHF